MYLELVFLFVDVQLSAYDCSLFQSIQYGKQAATNRAGPVFQECHQNWKQSRAQMRYDGVINRIVVGRWEWKNVPLAP